MALSSHSLLLRGAQRALCLVLAAGCLLAPAQAQLPSLGDGNDMGTAAERRLGERIARELYRDPDFIEDAVLEDYVQSIWQPLIAAAKQRGELSPELGERFAWEILMGRDRSINAFALPGGYLGLHLGLMGVVSTRDELASVLAHELTHVTQRHIARLMGQSSRLAPWAIGAMILGALAASKSPDAANAMIMGGQAAVAQSQLNFSRDMEREADRIGYGVMTQAGFDPAGFVTMFGKLQQASKLNDNGAFPYLRSHPLTTERIADMQARQALLERRAAPAQPDIVHAMMAARARVLSNPGPDRLRSQVAEAQGLAAGSTAESAPAIWYAGALAASRLRDAPAALVLADRLRSGVQADPKAVRLAHLLAAEIAWSAQDAARAQAALAAIPKDQAGRPETMLMAQIQVRNGQAAQAAQALQARVALEPRDAVAWQLLSSAYAEQGQTLRAIRAEAEQQVARLDYTGALDRFKAAQNFARGPQQSRAPGDHIEASIIDTRTRQLESLVKEQALERDIN
ncbi:M48 family metalloprotease [Pseudorhodoferax sp. Leaf267]|uniref:M48 family metalloprotease n=1 Tax=Pseudorhodoferax sp. Leaf267 TaxID=1736316 RepID=UPI0006FDDA18|nr:M48 family metalloprotease [Pseudorhodoferax sp. Leaf267]KQP12724.1 peptidase M48 [Pseudorhodoferax sp. Leaf267]